MSTMTTLSPVMPIAPLWAPAAWLRGSCELAISAYQRWLSPHKGYCCAHRVLHQGESCSQYVKRAIAVGGVRQAFGLARARFEDCGRAAIRLARRQRRAELLASHAHAGVPCAAIAVAAEPDDETRRRQDELHDAAHEVADAGAEVAESVAEEAVSAALEAVGSAIADLFGAAAEAAGQGFAAAGEVLAGGLDLGGAACEAAAGAGGECCMGAACGCAF